MDQPDFRALCAELVTAFKDENTYTQRIEILERARAALVTLPPTDEELMVLEEELEKELMVLEKRLWDKYKTIPYQGDEFMYDDGFEYALCDYRSFLQIRWGK